MCTNPRHSFDSEVASRPRRRPDDGSALAFGTLFSSQGANPGRVPFLAPALPTKKKTAGSRADGVCRIRST